MGNGPRPKAAPRPTTGGRNGQGSDPGTGDPIFVLGYLLGHRGSPGELFFILKQITLYEGLVGLLKCHLKDSPIIESAIKKPE